jgi:hypothetical protein
MAENETETNEATETAPTGGSNARSAAKAAVAAAATGAAAIAVRKALSGGSDGKSTTNGDPSSAGKGPNTLLSSIASGGWDAARDAVVPIAEDAAGAAGAYVAKNGPDVVRDRIVPRFITAFNEARKEE